MIDFEKQTESFFMQTFLIVMFVVLPLLCGILLTILVFGIRFIMGIAVKEENAEYEWNSLVSRLVNETKQAEKSDFAFIPRAVTPQSGDSLTYRSTPRSPSGLFSCAIAGTC